MPKGEPAKKKRKNMVSSSEDSDSDENTATVNDKTAMLGSSNSDSEDAQSGKSIGTNDAVSQSSSDMSDTDDDKFPDGLDKDFMGDTEDREKLQNMNELDREHELYRRMEVRDEMLKQKRAKKVLRKQKKEERRNRRENQLEKQQQLKGKSGRGGETSDSDEDSDEEGAKDKDSSDVDSDDSDTNMKITKRKGVIKSSSEEEESSSLMDTSDSEEEYATTTADRKKVAAKKQARRLVRERKLKKRKDRERSKAKSTLKVDEIFSGSSSDDNNKKSKKGKIFSSDGESGEIGSSDDDKQQDDAADDNTIDTVEELNRAKLSRFRCEQWCAAPWFDKAIKGTYVRIGLGVNKETGREVHRVCEVIGILKTHTPYGLPSVGRTNVALNVKLGDSKRGFRILYVSNQPFSESEFAFWKKYESEKNKDLPTMRQIKNIEKQINIYKEKEVNMAPKEFEQMVKEKTKHRAKPTNFARDKSFIKKQIKDAEEQQEHSKANMLKRKLQDIDKQASQITNERTREIQNADKINDQIRTTFSRNLEATRVENEKYRQKQEVDPFMRRKCQPLMGNTQMCIDAMDRKYKTDIDMSYENKTFVEQDQKDKAAAEKKRKEQFNLNSGEQKLENAHDFDLGIDSLFADAGVATVMVKEVSSSGARKSGGRINLAEWKRKKGLI